MDEKKKNTVDIPTISTDEETVVSPAEIEKKKSQDETHTSADAETVVSTVEGNKQIYSDSNKTQIDNTQLSPGERTIFAPMPEEKVRSHLRPTSLNQRPRPQRISSTPLTAPVNGEEESTHFIHTEEIDSDHFNKMTEEITIHSNLDKVSSETTINNQSTIKGDDYSETIAGPRDKENSKSDTSSEKTAALFSISDIQQKIDNEIANIPENYKDELSQAHLSYLMKSQIGGKSDGSKIKINRHFLLDAEPFSLKRLMDEIQKTPDGLKTGFNGLDPYITIPADALTLITSRAKHGKTSFMLNLLLNMCNIYPDKHFIFYTYEEPKWEIIVKLINMCGLKQFSSLAGGDIISNIQRWKYEFKNCEIDEIQAKSEQDSEYYGLKRFMELAAKIHVVSSNHNCSQIFKSIDSFTQAFDVGAVFIDSFQKIKPDPEYASMELRMQLQEISNRLRILAHETRFPVLISTRLSPGPKGTPEYDDLSENNLREAGNAAQMASLIIGLQNYARSKYLGSNENENFTSAFIETPLNKADKMPDNLKDIMQKTIIRVKVISNITGQEPETELLFHKQLLRLSDLHEETKDSTQGN